MADADQPFGQGQGGFEGLGQPQAHICFHFKAIDDHLNGVFLVFRQRGCFV